MLAYAKIIASSVLRLAKFRSSYGTVTRRFLIQQLPDLGSWLSYVVLQALCESEFEYI